MVHTVCEQFIKARKQRRSYSDVLWPKRRPETLANTIVAREMNNWESVFHQFYDSTIEIMLSSSTLNLVYDGIPRKVSCLHS